MSKIQNQESCMLIMRARKQELAQVNIMSFSINPFHENINPGTTKELNLFLKATIPLEEDKCFDLKSNNVKALMDHLIQEGKRFGWK